MIINDYTGHEWAIFHSYVKQPKGAFDTFPFKKERIETNNSRRRGLNTPTREARGGADGV